MRFNNATLHIKNKHIQSIIVRSSRTKYIFNSYLNEFDQKLTIFRAVMHKLLANSKGRLGRNQNRCSNKCPSESNTTRQSRQRGISSNCVGNRQSHSGLCYGVVEQQGNRHQCRLHCRHYISHQNCTAIRCHS